MLSIFIFFFIGKYYYELAQDYYKHRWLYGLLGIVVYYIGTAIGGFFLGVVDELFDLRINWANTFGLSVLALVFGVLSTSIVYFLIKKQWKKSNIVVVDEDEIKDIGKNIEENN